MSKLRILFVNEASFLSTGFGTYGLEVLNRLHKTGKYELAELASYGHPRDIRQRDFPWKYYGNMPQTKEEESIYWNNPSYQWGEWKFEQTCLDFKPDVVWSIRDWWSDEFIERSPFRRMYQWYTMPTVDGIPQDDDWIATYTNADAIFSYSEFGKEVLSAQSSEHIKVIDIISPGVDLATFKPVKNKEEAKDSFGLEKDVFIVGTVMRNQRRKLYPDLFKSFRNLLNRLSPEISTKTYLYCHTAYPDLGWKIPRLLKENALCSKVLFTYKCQKCENVFPSFFADSRTACNKCNGIAVLPNSQTGITREDLSRVYNTFDIYVQYANAEGFGMPIVEAAACGLPVMVVDYSAMQDFKQTLGAIPINVLTLNRESDTHRYMAVPDNEDFVNKLEQLISLPKSMLLRNGFTARLGAEKYSWDDTAKKWDHYFSGITPKDPLQTWASPARIHKPETKLPTQLHYSEFVKWGLTNLAGRPDLVNSYTYTRMVRNLNYGCAGDLVGGLAYNEMSMFSQGLKVRKYDQQICAEELVRMCEHFNFWETKRKELSHA
jgi:glycosyltransferase involved in cell wall biosynthesis